MKKILLLGGSAQQVIAIEKAKELGYYTVLCDFLPDNPGQYVADAFYLVSTTDKEAVLQVAREEKVQGILAYASDPAAPTAAYVAEKMGLPGSPYASVDILCNKDKFRAFLADNGFCTPRAAGYDSVAAALADLEKGRFAFPVIAKPVDSSGSKGVTVLREWAGFADAIQNADFSDYWFIAELDGSMDPARRYRLEGYLFPDTYEFYTDWTETQILRKLLDNFATKFDIAYKERCDELGLSVDEVIILASMIQMEAKYAEEYGAISSVFHNRLKSSAFMKRLDSDATIQYALGTDRKSELTHEDTELDSPYNTYTNPGLPPGPISNPSLNAISYALYPDKTEYYYFVAKPNGYSLFATTEPEHLENIRIARGQ